MRKTIADILEKFKDSSKSAEIFKTFEPFSNILENFSKISKFTEITKPFKPFIYLQREF